MRQRGYQFGPWTRFLITSAVVVGVCFIPAVQRAIQQGYRIVGNSIQHLTVISHIIPISGDLTKENADLRRTNALLTTQVNTLKAGLEAAGSLDRIQSFLTTTKRQGVAASIIGYSDDPGIKTFSISVGVSDGIQVGMAVVSDTGFLVGKIIAVRDQVSVVRDIRDSQSSVLTRVDNPQKSQGVLRGQRGITLRMSFIPKDDPITSGDVISTSGAEPLIPPGIPIGTISDLDTRAGDVFQTANVFCPIRIWRFPPWP